MRSMKLTPVELGVRDTARVLLVGKTPPSLLNIPEVPVDWLPTETAKEGNHG